MVDVTQAMESSYVTVDLVRASPTRKCVIVDGGQYTQEKSQDGKEYVKFSLTIEIDGKKKTWTPNKDSVKNIVEEYGKNSDNWIGKIIKLSIGKILGKDAVIGIPMPMPKTTEETIN